MVSAGPSPELTICTVSFHSAEYLRRNMALTAQLNARSTVQWVVVDNSPGETAGPPGDGSTDVRVVPGPQVEAPQATLHSGSVNHGAGLNLALSLVQTRFVLALDPDFFIVRPGWVGDVTRYMATRRLGFLGAPWHPRWFGKWRYFPCAHCLFIDLDKVDRNRLDFRPRLDETPTTSRDALRLHPRLRAVASGMKGLLLNGRLRRSIGSSRDSGYGVFHEFGRRADSGSECLTPVCSFPEDYLAYRPRRANWFIDYLLPDRLSYRPKRPGYFSESGFSERGLPSPRSVGWEEFLWHGEAFGFHLRRQRSRPRVDEAAVIDEILTAAVEQTLRQAQCERGAHRLATAPADAQARRLLLDE